MGSLVRWVSSMSLLYIQNRKNVGNASGLSASFSFRCAAQKRHGGWGSSCVRRDYVPPAHSAKYVIYRNLLRLMSGKSPSIFSGTQRCSPRRKAVGYAHSFARAATCRAFRRRATPCGCIHARHTAPSTFIACPFFFNFSSTL